MSTLSQGQSSSTHHAGGCLVIDPLGEIVAETHCERIQEEMLVVDLLPEKLWEARSKPSQKLPAKPEA